MNAQYRYPGPRSFTEKDRELFFGRNKEIRKLTELVVIEKLVVLFGKSGYGKTSLLQAGVIPRLEEKESHQVLELFLSEPEEPEISPLEQFLAQLSNATAKDTFVSDKLDIEAELPFDEAAKLWYYAKNIQLSNEDKEAITLVFDHFEKLFVYRVLQAKALARALSYLLQARPPKSVRRLINDKTTSNPAYFSEEELKGLLRPMNVKLLISVNHNQVASLDMLKSILPTIFKYTYELQPLNEFQAIEILQKPAKKEGSYKSPVFSYSDEALKNIVENLRDDKNRRIETFQLQLIGQHAEEVVIGMHNSKPNPDGYVLTSEDLGDPEAVLEDHYKEIIAGLPRLKRSNSRKLVETVLIVDGHRVPVADSIIIAKYKIPNNVLGTLTDRRLLRAERNSVGGLSYELSHDTLVPPIIKTAKARKRKELKRNLLIAGIILLFLTVSAASWGVMEMNRADDLEVKVDSLENALKNLKAKAAAKLDEGPAEEVSTVTDTTTVDVNSNEVAVETEGPDNNETVTADESEDEAGAGGGNDSVTEDDDEGGDEVATDDSDEETEDPDDTAEEPDNGEDGTGSDDQEDETAPKVVLYSDWMKRLKSLKVKLQEQPGLEHTMVMEYENASDTRKVGEWDFDSGEAHLIAIRKLPLIPRVFDAKKDDALFVLLVDGETYVFYGFTGHFEATDQRNNRGRAKTGFIAEGQHKYRIENTGSERRLVPYQDGVLLFRDRDNNRELSARDLKAGLYPDPIETADIQWHPLGMTNTLTGVQFISENSYLNPDDEIVSQIVLDQNTGELTNNSSVNAYDTFIDRIWGDPERESLFYTVVDWSDFDGDSKEEITRTMNRLRNGA